MNTESISFVVFALWPLFLFLFVPIDHISGNFLVCCQHTDPQKYVWLSLFLRFYAIYFFIMATTWIYVLERDAQWTNSSQTIALGAAFGGITTGLTFVLEYFQSRVNVTLKSSKPATGTKRDAASNDAEATVVKQCRMATWVAPLCVSIVYNALGTSQYNWNPALRSTLYMLVLCSSSVLSTRGWVTDVHYANAWNIVFSAVFEFAMCMYATQITQLVYREAASESNISMRWNEVGIDSTAFVGFATIRFLLLYFVQDRFWGWWTDHTRKNACCCRERRVPLTSNTRRAAGKPEYQPIPVAEPQHTLVLADPK